MSIETTIHHLQSLLGQGKLSRREFFKKTAALGLTASLASMYAAKPVLAIVPKKGGIFRAGISGASNTDSLDPEKHIGVGMVNLITFSMHAYLTETGPKGKLSPSLAESWESTPDAKTWMFKLTKGVEFHNGKTVTVEDVIASINVHRGENTKSATKPLLAGIEDITADGANTVVFRLKDGNADLPYLLSHFSLGIFPAKGNGIDWQSDIGAGGYILKAYETGVSARLVKNPNYWQDRGFFDEIEILGITDPVARLTALTTGKVDAIDYVDYKVADRVNKIDNIDVVETNGGLHRTLPMHTDTAPFNDNNVRLAIKYSVDREALVKTILQGHGEVGNDHPIGSNSRFFNKELEQRTYDPDKAKFYLKKAGLSDLQLNLSAADAGGIGAVDMAILFKEHAKKSGISITVIREPEDGYWSNVWLKKPWCLSYWGGTQTEDIAFTQAYAGDAPWNEARWKNDRFDDLLLRARAELDFNKRREMYWEMQTILNQDGGSVIPIFPNYVCAVSTKLAHNEIEERWSLDGYKAGLRWWFA